MIRWILPLLTSLAMCAPRTMRPQTPASQDACPLSKDEEESLSKQLGSIDAAVASKDLEALESARYHLSKILDHSAFQTTTGERAVSPPLSVRALVDWWARGGRLWAFGQVIRDQQILRIPPTMRTEPLSIPGDIACSSGVCDPQATAFLETVADRGVLLESYERGRLRDIRWNRPEGDIKGNPIQLMCPERTYADWRDCIERNRSVQSGFPLGDYRFPSDGWVFVELFGLMAEKCPLRLAFSLESGDVFWTEECKVRFGRGDVNRFREFSIVAVLANSVDDFSSLQEISVPTHLASSDECSSNSAPPEPRKKSSSHEDLMFWWWKDGRIVAVGHLETSNFLKPADSFAARLIDVAKITFSTGMTKISLPDVSSDDARLAALLKVFRS